MRRLIDPFAAVAALTLALATPAWAQSAAPTVRDATTAAAMARIGRVATPDEVKAWDIDVRADFVGLPKGKGDVATGEAIWEAQCASCHGVFGESNEVFTPIAGGTTLRDVEAGRVANLRADAGFAQRTTLMKASQLSTLWDYVNRAMPWNAPKSLTADEVYAVVAYMLNLGDIVPADFTLSDQNVADVQKRMPNRNGMVFHRDLWDVGGRGDVVNEACMTDCRIEGTGVVVLPVEARDTHGNIADQVRGFGPARGMAFAGLASGATSGTPSSPGAPSPGGPAAVAAAAPSAAGAAAPPAGPDVPALLKASGCLACHGIGNKIVGPALRDIAPKHVGRTDLEDYLAERIVKGGQGVWGPIPMPPQPQVSETDRRAMARWMAAGGR